MVPVDRIGKHVLCRARCLTLSHRISQNEYRNFSSLMPLYKGMREVERQPEHGKKSHRITGQNPLRKVAIKAERTRLAKESLDKQVSWQRHPKKVIAYCAAEQYDMQAASKALRGEGFVIDPLQTGLFPEVLHARLPDPSDHVVQPNLMPGLDVQADILVFPSGTVVTWNVAKSTAVHTVKQILNPAMLNFHSTYMEMEEEDLEFIEDPTKTRSDIIGETIIVGTCTVRTAQNDNSVSTQMDSVQRSEVENVSEINTILAKIAFSSGMARSTKLGMLERLTESYIASTRSIPLIMSKGAWSGSLPTFWRRFCDTLGLTPRLPFSRPFILRKTGELLAIRAQLNLYSELTDSLPDLFWDSKHELQLENYYDMIARALDVGVRIKILNEKMDYAQEIATTLRETLSERHNLRLEWGIIVLIAIEVLFEVDQRWRRNS